MLRKILLFAGIALSLFIIHFFVFTIPGLKETGNAFIYPLWQVYLFFFGMSVAILFILVQASRKNKEQLGYIFLALTTVKLGVSYFFAKPMLEKHLTAEKINFFTVFILFLAIEVYFTLRLLNNKQ